MSSPAPVTAPAALSTETEATPVAAETAALVTAADVGATDVAPPPAEVPKPVVAVQVRSGKLASNTRRQKAAAWPIVEVAAQDVAALPTGKAALLQADGDKLPALKSTSKVPAGAPKAKPAATAVPAKSGAKVPVKAAAKPVKPVKAVKSTKASQPAVVAQPVAAKPARKASAKSAKNASVIAPAAPAVTNAKVDRTKEKLVRDSFTMPRADFALIQQLKERGLGFKRAVRKSELLRAGLQALAAMDDAVLKALLDSLPALKAGRPRKAG